MEKYVMGLVFRQGNQQVAMVKKSRGPRINIGKQNAIGGGVNPSEPFPKAMAREFLEETGNGVTDWEKVGAICGSDWMVTIYKSYAEISLPPKNDVDEFLSWQNVKFIFNPEFRNEYSQNIPSIVAHCLYGEGQLSIWADKDSS